MALFRSHLFWFVVIGAAIFAIDAARPKSDDIIVDESVAIRIAGMWQGQMGRPPTAEELQSLLAAWVEEEMLYRKALTLELDKGDAIVRRRLVQKISFIAEEAALEEPTDAELQTWFDQRKDEYRLPVRVSFQHIRVPDAEDASALAARLQGETNWRALGAPSMQNPAYALVTAREVRSLFGNNFAEALFELDASADWQGPLESEFGRHLVRITEQRPPEVPALADIANRVRNDYLGAAREQARDNYVAELRREYDVLWRVER